MSDEARPGMAQRVVIVYRDPLLRDVVANLLNDERDIQVVAACRVEQFHPQMLTEHTPDVVVADRMPAVELQALLDEVANRVPHARLVSVNLSSDDLTVYRGLRRAKAGAEELLDAVRDVPTA